MNLLRTLDLAFIGLIVFHCYLSPFTKVEESFNLQAVHDLLEYGPLDLSNYDHQVFPGVVKRTFVGAGVLAALVKPIVSVMPESDTLMVYQYAVRVVLGLLNGYLIIRIRRVLAKVSRYSNLSFYYALLQYSQFHIVYYSSRTLPNFILLPLVNYALGSIVQGKFNGGFILLSLTAVIFRAEIGVFAICSGFIAIFSLQLPVQKIPIALIIGGIIGLVITLLVDSYFWSEFPCVPEIASIFFNVYEGNSKLWGVEPFTAYFTRYFMSIFCPPTVLFLSLPGLFYKTTNTKSNYIRTIGLGSLLFVLLMSFQPHKEWRFIIYAVPGLTLLAANGATGLQRTRLQSIIKLAIIGSSIISLFVSLIMLHISSMNYPGGVAITSLNGALKLLDDKLTLSDVYGKNVTIHMDVPACMTGVTLFTEIRPGSLKTFNVIYDKQEDKLVLQEEQTWKAFDYVITDFNQDQSPQGKRDLKLPSIEGLEWRKIASIKGFSGINVFPLISIVRNYHIALGYAKNLISGDFEPIAELLNSVITQKEKLFIYTKNEI